MAMVGRVWAGMEVVDGMYVGQSQEGLVTCFDTAGELPQC